jgi:hypothetical protein
MSRPEARPQRALNIAALVILLVLAAWIAVSQVMRRAQHRAQEAQQKEQERQRLAARLKLPTRAFEDGRPEPDNARGPVACLYATDLGDAGLLYQWNITKEVPASASVLPQGSRSNTVRFTMGESRFTLERPAVGVKVSILWEAADVMWEADAVDVLVRLTSGGKPLGENKASGGMLPTKLAFTDYGDAADAWGTGDAIPADVVNAADFGVEIVVKGNSPFCAVKINGITITAYEQ